MDVVGRISDFWVYAELREFVFAEWVHVLWLRHDCVSNLCQRGLNTWGAETFFTEKPPNLPITLHYNICGCITAKFHQDIHVTTMTFWLIFQKGEGLQSTIEALPKFQGILNGIDDKVWNPATDSFLRNHYSAANLKGKQLIKNSLRRRLRMAYEGVDAKRPLVSEYIETISFMRGCHFLHCK